MKEKRTYKPKTKCKTLLCTKTTTGDYKYTKGKTYKAVKSMGSWVVFDDKKRWIRFANLTIIFTEIETT